MARILLMIVIALSLAGAAAAASSDEPVGALPPDEQPALNAAVADMCGKRIALLGEATHGDGHTEAFKVALVERLVTRCHFTAVLFEASQYQFIDFARALRQRRATPASLSTAIGGLWKFDREFQPLVPFLFREAAARRVMLGGLDGQFGSFESPYANDGMPDELTAYLMGDRATACRAAFRWRIENFQSDASVAAANRATLLGCTTDIRHAVDARRSLDAATRDETVAMLATIDRFAAADPTDQTAYTANRDRAMYLTLRWYADRLPRGAKIVVWAANVHVARQSSADPPDAMAVPLGQYVRRDYGNRAFALGITAAGGSYRWTRKDYRPVDAPPGSLEARAMGGGANGAVYLDRASLARLGAASAGFLRHRQLTADWSAMFDGAIVIGAERPPHSTRPGYF